MSPRSLAAGIRAAGALVFDVPNGSGTVKLFDEEGFILGGWRTTQH